jgi:integrase
MSVYRPKYRDPKTGKPIESTIWWCEFSFAGKRYRESTKESRKTLAVAFEKDKRLKVEQAYAGVAADSTPKARVRTVAESLRAYKGTYSVGHRPKSIAWVEERSVHVERLLGSVSLMDLSEERVRQYMKTRLAERAGHRTVNMELECLSRAIGRTWRALWPKLRKLEERKDAGRALSTVEEGRLLGASIRNKSPLIGAFIRVGLLTGMRSAEIRTLQVERVNLQNRTLRVGQAKTAAGTGREIPMNAALYETLADQVALLREKFGPPRPEWFLFPFCNTVQPIDPTRPVTTVKTAWESVRTAAGVDCRFHDLRHTALTKMAEADVPESTMKALAGHMSRAMLERYSHIRMEAKRRAVESLTLADPSPMGLPQENPKVTQRRLLRVVGK